jgi:GcrA cell cycle regulator
MSAEHGAGWTEERVDRLLKMRAAGDSAGTIARALGGGVSRSAVIGKLQRLKAPSPVNKKPTTPGSEVMRRIRREGAGKPAVRFGVCPPTPKQAEVDARRAELAAGLKESARHFETPADADPVPLIGRGWGRCAWPVGTPARPAEQMCCGRTTTPDQSWCPDHRKLAFDPTPHMGSKYERQLRRWL